MFFIKFKNFKSFFKLFSIFNVKHNELMPIQMNLNESLKAVVEKFFNVYRSIPAYCFRNSVTYESLVDENFIGKIHCDEFPLGAKLSFIRKAEGENEYVGFYPAFFYDKQEVGLSARYYNIKKSIYKKIGPARTVDEFIEHLEKVNNDNEKEIYDYIVYSMKVDSGFLMTYQEANDNFMEILKSYPKLPLMKCFDEAEHLGTKLEIAGEYIINPYVFEGIAVEMYSLSEDSGTVNRHYVQMSPDSLSLYRGWEPLNKTRLNDALTAICKSIEKKRRFEDKIVEIVKSL